MEFESKEKLDEYIEQMNYGLSEDVPMVCFASSINENEDKNKYDVELFFDESLPSAYRSVPYLSYGYNWESEFLPKIDEYSRYQWYGVAYL